MKENKKEKKNKEKSLKQEWQKQDSSNRLFNDKNFR